MTWHKSFGESARQIAKQVPFITENLNLPFRDKDWLPPLNLSRSESSPCRNNPIFWGHEAVNVQSPCRGSRSGSKKNTISNTAIVFHSWNWLTCSSGARNWLFCSSWRRSLRLNASISYFGCGSQISADWCLKWPLSWRSIGTSEIQ